MSEPTQQADPRIEAPQEVTLTPAQYEGLQLEAARIAALVAKFPFATVVAAIEKVNEVAATLPEDSEARKTYEKLAYRRTMNYQIAFTLNVAGEAIRRSMKQYLDYIKEHPELKEDRALFTPKNAGRIILAK